MKRICKNTFCKKEFEARTADVNRGWGNFCCKSCKAVEQEKRTGQYADYKAGRVKVKAPATSNELLGVLAQRLRRFNEDTCGMDGAEDGGWDAHKDWT